MELIYIALGIISGWVIGRMYMIYELRHTIRYLKDHNSIIIPVETEEEKVYIPYYRIETHGSSFYLFDKKDIFICQAKTIEDLAKSLYNLADVKKALIKHNEEFLLFNKGEIMRLENESEYR